MKTLADFQVGQRVRHLKLDRHEFTDGTIVETPADDLCRQFVWVRFDGESNIKRGFKPEDLIHIPQQITP